MSKSTLQTQIAGLRKDLGKVRKSIQSSMYREKIIAAIEIIFTIIIMIGPQASSIWRAIIGSIRNYVI